MPAGVAVAHEDFAHDVGAWWRRHARSSMAPAAPALPTCSFEIPPTSKLRAGGASRLKHLPAAHR
jgi:hypothetical protein